MKKIDLGQTVTILANLGVIAGIVFLAVELRQNNALMAAQARFNQLSAQAETHIILAENPDLAWALVRANNNEELNPEEEASLQYYVRSVFTKMQWTYGEIPEGARPLERWRKVSAEPYRRRFWAESKGEFNQNFVAWMEEHVIN